MITVKVFFVKEENLPPYEYTVKSTGSESAETRAKRYAYKVINEGFRMRLPDRLIYRGPDKIDHVEVIGTDGELCRQDLNEDRK